MRRHLTFANVAAATALFIAISGVTAYASGRIGPKDIRNNATRSRHVKNHSLKGEGPRSEDRSPVWLPRGAGAQRRRAWLR
jgi:hypothetical protein